LSLRLRSSSPFKRSINGDCAGATRDAGGDLYLASDYLACGGRRPGHAPVREKLDSPAPIPAYDVALFAIVARLPYTFAAYLWLALSTVAIFGGAIFFARAADLPPPLVAGTFAIIAETALYYGQLTPIALGALCLAAFAAQRGRMWLAGAAVVAATIEPHVGIPALLAAAIYLPRSRAAIGAGLVVMLLASLAGCSFQEDVQYVTSVMPLHIRAEVPMVNQYSLTWLLAAVGVPVEVAVKAGSLSYLIMIAVGLWLAPRVARAVESDAAIVLVPVACAMLGGPFIHDNQVALALPAILLIAGRVRRPTPLLWLAVALLAVRWSDIVWQTHPYTPMRLESVALVAVIAYYAASRSSRATAAATMVSCVLAYVAISLLIAHVSSTPWNRPQSSALYAKQLGADVAYASGRYGVTLRAYADQVQISWQVIAGKLPSWTALLAFLWCAVRLRASPLSSAARVAR
jgi:hypothetical protein